MKGNNHISISLLICLYLLAWAKPAIAQYDITASATEGCSPLQVKFTFTDAASVDTITSFYWDFGNGQTSTLKDPPEITYETAGTYSPSLIYNSRADLMIVKTGLVTVHHTVKASFTYHDTVSTYTYVFEPVSPLDAGKTYTYQWDFEGIGIRNNRREIVTFPSLDTFDVSLTVSDNYGCSNTTSQKVLVLNEIVVQNVFTPNGDNNNDFFVISSDVNTPVVVRIFTRAGILVYENEGSTVTWDGFTASGQKLNPGIYFYTIEALQGDPDKKYTKAGVLYMYR